MTKLGERSWVAVFEIAKIVESGGLVLRERDKRDPTRRAEKEASIEKRRKDRFRQAGAAIPEDMWRRASYADVLDALDDHFDVPAVQRMLLDDEDEDDRMIAWTRRGLRRRRAARWLTWSGRVCSLCGTLVRRGVCHAGLSPRDARGAQHADPLGQRSRSTVGLLQQGPERFLRLPRARAARGRRVVRGYHLLRVRAVPGAGHRGKRGVLEAPTRVRDFRRLRQAGDGVRQRVVGGSTRPRGCGGGARCGDSHGVDARRRVDAHSHVAVGDAHDDAVAAGDAAGWNQWRAASFGAAAWVGTLCIAAKMFGHDPAYLPFLNEPSVPGGGAPTSANAEDAKSRRTFGGWFSP